MTLNFDVEVTLKPSHCVECGHKMDCISGPVEPKPGDMTLCIKCASLNVLSDDMMLRRPTDDEMLEVAASPQFQRARRMILEVNKAIAKR